MVRTGITFKINNNSFIYIPYQDENYCVAIVIFQLRASILFSCMLDIYQVAFLSSGDVCQGNWASHSVRSTAEGQYVSKQGYWPDSEVANSVAESKQEWLWRIGSQTFTRKQTTKWHCALHKETGTVSANTKHLYNICTMLVQRRRRWADVVQILYKCFVFTGLIGGVEVNAYVLFPTFHRKCC